MVRSKQEAPENPYCELFILQEKPESEKRELCVSAFVITAAIISKLDQLTVIIFIFLKTSKNDLIGRFVIMF